MKQMGGISVFEASCRRDVARCARSSALPRFARRLLVLATLAVFTPMAVAGPDHSELLERDFAYFLTLWGGGYDNREQVERPVSKEDLVPLTLHMQRVDLPAFGEHVFYVEWQSLDEPSNVFRQRLYSLRIDREEQVLRLELYIWPAERPEFVERTRGAHRDPARLASVTPEDMVDIGDCDVRFHRKGQGFEGAMRRGSCAFDAPDGTPIYSWTQMRIAPDSFEYLDGWFHHDESLYQGFSDMWYRFTRRNVP